MGLGEGLAGTDAEYAGNGIRLMGHIILHVLVLLQLLFCKREKTVACIGEMNPFIGTNK